MVSEEKGNMALLVPPSFAKISLQISHITVLPQDTAVPPPKKFM
jgi:hypothetical protein